MYMIGIADSEYDMFLKMKDFITGVGFIGQAQVTPFGGGIRGNLSNWYVKDAHINEVITFTCDQATPAAHYSSWEVTSTTLLDQIDAESNSMYRTVGKEYQAYIDINPANPYVVGDLITLRSVVRGTTGAGKATLVTPTKLTKTETIALTCTQKGSANVTGDTAVVNLFLGVPVSIPKARNLSAVSIPLLTVGVDYSVQAVDGTITLLSNVNHIEGAPATVTFTSTQSAAVFSAVGSITDLALQGASSYTEGAAFTCLQLSFTIPRVSTTVRAEQFDLGDTMTFYMTENPLKAVGQEWEQLHSESAAIAYHGGGTPMQEVKAIFKGKGIAGSDNIFVGINRAVVPDSNSAWRLKGFRAYSSLSTFEGQLGWRNASPRLTMWNQEIPFWLRADGRSIQLVAKSSTYYTQMFLGLYLPDEEPQFNPYPLMIGGNQGEVDSVTTLWNQVSPKNSCYWCSHTQDPLTPTCMFLDKTNVWVPIYVRDEEDEAKVLMSNWIANPTVTVYPYALEGMRFTRQNLDGTFTPIPMEIVTRKFTNHPFIGTLDGLYAVSGYGNQAPENILVTADNRHMIVFHNVYRNQTDEYMAMELK